MVQIVLYELVTYVTILNTGKGCSVDHRLAALLKLSEILRWSKQHIRVRQKCQEMDP